MQCCRNWLKLRTPYSLKDMNGIGRKTGKQGGVFPLRGPDRRSDLLRKRKRFCKTPNCDLAPKRGWRKGYCTWHARTQQGLEDPNPKRNHHAQKRGAPAGRGPPARPGRRVATAASPAQPSPASPSQPAKGSQPGPASPHPHRIPIEFPLDPLWIPIGFLLDSNWIPIAVISVLDSYWIHIGFLMDYH